MPDCKANHPEGVMEHSLGLQPQEESGKNQAP